MTIIQKADSPDYLQQILTLQQQNLYKNLTAKEMEKEGFVTVEHSYDMLQAMNNKHPHTIAVANNQVVGYALSMHPSFGNQIPELLSMDAVLKSLDPPEENYIIMGQICIAKTHRGQGLFKRLYNYMKANLPLGIDTIVTEVAATNTRSLYAHMAAGFEEITRHTEQHKEWVLIKL